MDTEEKKSTTPPQGKSGKRRKKKPAADKTEGLTAPREETARAEAAPAQAPDQPEKPATQEEPAPGADGAAPAPAPGQPAGDTAPEPAAEPAPDEKPEEESQVPADPEPTPPAPEEKPAEKTAEPAPAETDDQPAAPAPDQPAEEEPLPDGLSFTEEDLSDALDKMLEPGQEPAREEPGPAPESPQTAGEPEAGETPEKAPEQDPETTEAPAPADTDGEGEKPDAETVPAEEETAEEEEEKRLSDMTRTVQLSVEQIMARMEEESAAAGPEPDGQPEEEAPATLQDHLRNGVSGMCKWLLLVVFFVLVIAGAGVAWLYRSATPDMVPSITVTFGGQAVEPAAYKWKVPVVGNLFKRTYAETLSSVPVELAETVEQASPDVQISPSDYRTEFTVTDSQDNVLFEGDAEEFTSFQFLANGDYTAKLVVYIDQSKISGAADVSGSETWLFHFTVGVRASVHLSNESVTQGSVAAVRVGTTLDGQPPVIETELANGGFFPAGTGWVCYLPIPWNQPAGDYSINVTGSGHTETLTLKVREGDWEYKDYSRDSQRTEPYIGDDNLPAEVKKLLADTDTEIAWANSNFVQPFLRSLKVELAYGTTEYVGRSYSERQSNTGAGGRTAVNTILSTTRGELLIAPANGQVVLAKDLGSGYGNTLVIDHGAGVKSIFYGLDELEVKTGDPLKQGQTLATCGRTTVAELRIGTVPVDPLPVWRGQCDALKYY